MMRQSAWYDIPKHVFTRTEAAAEIGCSVKEMDGLIEDGKIKLAWLNGVECIIRYEIDDFLRKQSVKYPQADNRPA